MGVRLQPGHDLAVREFEPRVGLWAVSTEPNVGLKLTNCEIMTGAEVRRSTD